MKIAGPHRAIAAWLARLGLTLLVLFGAGLAGHARANPSRDLEGLVIGVSDGDTLLLDDGMAKRKVRLLGIDAPELAQPFGKVAKQVLLDRVLRRRVAVRVQSVDRYGRTVGKLLLDDADVNLELVRQGLAWHYGHFADAQFPGDAARYARSEREARNARQGLWRDPHPEAPWEWRRSHRRP